ncbi:cytochrome P450 [Pilatotrama ljubarskyi]|nr:cytochrome P450 [Pilatotrama ljubarskyi]
MVDSTYIGASTAGVASYLYFHKYGMRGDHALAFLTLSAVLAYGMIKVGFSDLSRSAAHEATLIYLAYVSTMLLLTVGYRLSPFHPLAEYPGPVICKITNLWLLYVSYGGKRYLALDRLHAKYGPFLHIASGPNALSINSPGATSLYLTLEKSDSYRMPDHDNKAVALFFKQESKEIHRERRRIWSGFFTPNGLAQILPLVEKRTWQFLRCLEKRQASNEAGYVDLVEAFFHWSYDLMGDFVFGGCNKLEFLENGDPDDVVNTGKVATALLDSVGLTPWILDIAWHIPFTKDMHALRRMAASMMRTRAKAEDVPGYRDLTSHWLEAGVPQEDLDLDAVIAIVGGSDNTAITLAFTIYYLIASPQYLKCLREELDKAFPDPVGELSMATLTALPFLNAVINETLRLASPYYLPCHVPAGGITVDDKYIPEGTDVALAAHSQQMSPDNFYPDPLNFHPLRWIPGGLGLQTKANKNVLASFSFREHACIGKTIAYQEMRHALARVILACDFEFPEGFDVPGVREGMQNMRTMFLEKPLLVRMSRHPGVNWPAVM